MSLKKGKKVDQKKKMPRKKHSVSKRKKKAGRT
jgi:hypothetical protein